MTVKALAYWSKIAESTIYQQLNGSRGFRVVHLVRLAEALGCDASDLLEGVDVRPMGKVPCVGISSESLGFPIEKLKTRKTKGWYALVRDSRGRIHSVLVDDDEPWKLIGSMIDLGE